MESNSQFHAALKWFLTLNNPNARLTRWSILLQTFDFDIVHRKGKIHSNVDALSRPVLSVNYDIDIMDENDVSEKYLDPYEDKPLLYFLQHGRHENSISKKRIKRISRLATKFKISKESN